MLMSCYMLKSNLTFNPVVKDLTMSVSYYAYCGPYIRCTTRFETQIQKFFGCVNEDCVNKNKEVANKTKFCSQCGNSIGTFSIEKQIDDRIDLHELFAGEEPLFKIFLEYGPKSIRNKYTILVSNFKDPHFDDKDKDTCRRFRVSFREGCVYQDLTKIDPKIEMAIFEKNHEKYIRKLREFYGSAEVVICWGFLTEAC